MAMRSRYIRPLNQAEAPAPPQTRSQTGPDGSPIVYLSRRLLPLPEQIAMQSTYVVQPGDRIDLVATRLLGDPLLYWLIADANGATDPTQLCAVPGRLLRVPAPLGQPQSTLDQPAAGDPSGSSAGHADDDAEG